jgi:hypothetical protein
MLDTIYQVHDSNLLVIVDDCRCDPSRNAVEIV